jgi:hypothetical protein
VVEELASLKSLHGTVTGGDLFLSVCKTIKELELPLTELNEVTTDRAPSMTGRKRGLMSRIRREMDKQNPEYYMELHCIIHQHSLCGRIMKSEHVMNVAVSVVNFT